MGRKGVFWCFTVADLSSARGVWPFCLLPLPPAGTWPTLSNSLRSSNSEPSMPTAAGQRKAHGTVMDSVRGRWASASPVWKAVLQAKESVWVFGCRRVFCMCLTVQMHCVNSITELTLKRWDFSWSLHWLFDMITDQDFQEECCTSQEENTSRHCTCYCFLGHSSPLGVNNVPKDPRQSEFYGL